MHTNTILGNRDNNETTRVREIYPQYLRDSAKNVISFLEEYYDYLNVETGPSYELQHVISENDIDETSEKYLDAIQGEIAKIIPNSTVIDRNTLYKRIVHYYRIKGTPESIDVFFKIFFDSLTELYYPGNDLFKLSEDGDLSGGKKIQDSTFWQDYSYQITTQLSAVQWRESYSRLVHPAGMKLFVLLLVEIVNRSGWIEPMSYLSSDDNNESWYSSLVPPAKRLQDAYEGYHTPRYQPGWLNSTQIATLIAIAELQYESALIDPYVNNFTHSAVNSSVARSNTFSNRTRESFDTSHNVSHSVFAIAGFPLTRQLQQGERIRFKFNYSTGANSEPIVALLKNKNDVDLTTPIADLGRCFEIINGVAQTGTAGHTLSANQTRQVVDITLESEDDCNQFIAFITEADTVDNDLSVDAFEVVDVDRNDYPIIDGGDSLSVISIADARYNRKQNFERTAVFDSTIILPALNYRSQYIHDGYTTGTPGERNPECWGDIRGISETGYSYYPLSAFSVSYEDAIELASVTNVNISDTQDAIINYYDISPAPLANYIMRPDGVSYYLRPDGVSRYEI